MANRRTDLYWRERVRAITAQSPRLGPKPIFRRLEQEGSNAGRADMPSERTIARIRNAFHGEKPATQRLYREVHWPESFLDGSLPWEAAELAIALFGIETRGRPLVRNVLWAWRITLARGDAPIGERWQAACYMSAWEVAPDLNGDKIPQAIEAWLRGTGNLVGLTIDGTGPDESIEALSGAEFPAAIPSDGEHESKNKARKVPAR